MEKFQKIELSFLVLILAFIVFLFLYSTGITGFSVSNDNQNAPYDFLSNDNIMVFNNSLTINLSNYTLVRFEGTGSMLPVLSESSTGVGIIPGSAKDVHVGDIINFESDKGIIVHRVIEIGDDELGTYFVTKGDNNNVGDGKVRFFQIRSVLVAVIY